MGVCLPWGSSVKFRTLGLSLRLKGEALNPLGQGVNPPCSVPEGHWGGVLRARNSWCEIRHGREAGAHQLLMHRRRLCSEECAAS